MLLPTAAILAAALLPGAGFGQTADEMEDDDEISEVTVSAKRVANSRPAGSYAAIATLLRFDPLTELQSRGLPEGQADVTVRGGLFENTGFKVGAVTVTDPQTGHYTAELPLDPAAISDPEMLTGIANALAGFNSNIATVAYSLPQVRAGGNVQLGAGSDDLAYGSLRWAGVGAVSSGAQLGYLLSAALSSGDGSVANGDHEFARYNVQLQHATDATQTDLILAYQDKFYGWPGAYTGFPTLLETDDTQTTLVLANHRRENDDGWVQIGGFYRGLEDDYDFDRTTDESGAPGSFDHKTRVYGAGIDGMYQRGRFEWHYAGQVTADELVRSTDLTNGEFTSRSYATLSLVPALDFRRSTDSVVTLRFGGTVDISNRDSNQFSPVLGASLQTTTARGVRFVEFEYAATSQVPGYTVLASGPSGLFGGNASLGREKARQLMLSLGHETANWQGSITVFHRRDDDLVDWTFASDSPFARQANPVDLDVFGAELLYRRSWDALDLSAGYTYLDKDADYGAATVDASFYALNFARHRATLALTYRFTDAFELRLDNEYREQQSNPLRASSDQAYIVSASLAWRPARSQGFDIAITADNLTDDDYQQFPGTPAIGRQVSVSARYAW